MPSGSFRTPTCTAAGSGYSRYIEVVWNSVNDIENNKSTINWSAYGRSEDASTTRYVMTGPLSININNTCVLNKTNRFELKKNQLLGSGSVSIPHNSDGTKTVNVGISANIYVGQSHSPNNTYSGTITMANNPVYTLSVSAGTGSNIVVNRTLCNGYGSTGNLSAGQKKLCKGDKLKISFSASPNYGIATHNVNSQPFASGNTHTVNGSVNVVSTATPLKSVVAATDANIGSTSIINITRYNPTYTHTLEYGFNGINGTIVSKTTSTSIAWTVPETFYAKIPSATSGVCTITCTTYNGSISIGTNTCTIIVNASQTICSPSVSGEVIDTNAITVALTGDSSKLIRYKSTAKCTITCEAKKSATISSKLINNTPPSNNVKVFNNISNPTFNFKVTDSRGYSAVKTVTSTMVAYIALTLNPVIVRPTPTGSSIIMTFSGNYYRGSFGAYTNTLTIRYRYRDIESSEYSEWTTIPPSSYSIGTSSYSTINAISLGDNFDYRKSYMFQVQAYDGADEYILSNITNNIPVKKGIPVFDWGENDFNFNVPVKIQGNEIHDFIIEQGMTGTWMYRKWNNGTAECWTKSTITIPSTTQSGQVYISNEISVELPPNLFQSAPIVTASASAPWTWIGTVRPNTTNIKFKIVQGFAYDPSFDVDIGIIAFGKWK